MRHQPLDDTLDERQPTEAELADATNERLLMAVMTDDDRDIRRAMEEGWGAWLNSHWSRNVNERTNPVLMAIVTPGSQRCLDAFQSWAHDVHRWDFGPWFAVHWAIAGHNEDALAWALRNGAAVLDLENEDTAKPGAPRRSGLAIAAQMGDPAWLRRVIEIATQPMVDLDDEMPRERRNYSVDELIRRDRWQKIPTLAIALHEMAEQDRQIAIGASPSGADRDGCVKVLVDLGFSPDNSKILAAKLTCAIALHDPQAPALQAYQRATLLAASLGSGINPLDDQHAAASEHAPVKLFEAAGARLDIEWRNALLLIGLQEGPDHGCWAEAASAILRQSLDGNAPGGVMGATWSRQKQDTVLDAMEASFAAMNLPISQRPMRGHEEAFVRWLGTDRAGEAIWQERMILADVAAEAAQAGYVPSVRAQRSRL